MMYLYGRSELNVWLEYTLHRTETTDYCSARGPGTTVFSGNWSRSVVAPISKPVLPNPIYINLAKWAFLKLDPCDLAGACFETGAIECRVP